MTEHWFRYHDEHYAAALDEYENPIGAGRIGVVLWRIPLIKETPKGVWIGYSPCTKRFVLKAAHKRYACSTEQEAKESFIARKKRQISILKARLRDAEEALKLME
jgi:hypothetical protein